MAGTASAGRGQTPPDGASRPTRGKSTSAAATRRRPTRERAAARRGGKGTENAVSGLPVREGEKGWTPSELAEIRDRLEAETAELRQEITRAESEIADRMGDMGEGAGDDQADAGAKTYAREHEMALAYNARDLLAQNERALQRIDGGTYGVCESCGRPIGKARLQAFPRATLCVRCKQREERR
jgi:DnaK suppressor protein